MNAPAGLLPKVIAAVEHASRMLIDEARRAGGPRGAGDKADVDAEIEVFLTDALTSLLPVRLVGEETGVHAGRPSDRCWLVDPHDGTRAFLQGHRGSAISVALLSNGVPVLGVVCAPMSPDRGHDLIAWAEGAPCLLRNGRKVRTDLRRAELSLESIVFLNQNAAAHPVGSGRAVAPARFVSLPSIAYRLARVAAGDGVAALSLNGPVAHDYAGAHALLRGSRGVLIDESGREVTYTREGESATRRCFGGAPTAVHDLQSRSWPALPPERLTRTPLVPAWPLSRSETANDRAVGCLYGQIVGGGVALLGRIGDRREGNRFEAVFELLDGRRRSVGFGPILCELGLVHARTLVAAEHAGDTIPPRISCTLCDRRGGPDGLLSVQAPPAPRLAEYVDAVGIGFASEEVCGLMRASSLGIAAPTPELAAIMTRIAVGRSPSGPVWSDACAAYAAAVAAGVAGGGPAAMLAAARRNARTQSVSAVLKRLNRREGTEVGPPAMPALVGLGDAFRILRETPHTEATLSNIGETGCTEICTAMAAGGLLGAAHGGSAMPARWTTAMMACRPHEELGAVEPRAMTCWPDDVPSLAEALLACRISA